VTTPEGKLTPAQFESSVRLDLQRINGARSGCISKTRDVGHTPCVWSIDWKRGWLQHTKSNQSFDTHHGRRAEGDSQVAREFVSFPGSASDLVLNLLGSAIVLEKVEEELEGVGDGASILNERKTIATLQIELPVAVDQSGQCCRWCFPGLRRGDSSVNSVSTSINPSVISPRIVTAPIAAVPVARRVGTAIGINADSTGGERNSRRNGQRT
jgi:hypothetical protein